MGRLGVDLGVGKGKALGRPMALKRKAKKGKCLWYFQTPLKGPLKVLVLVDDPR